jgi:hypothetical protein
MANYRLHNSGNCFFKWLSLSKLLYITYGCIGFRAYEV